MEKLKGTGKIPVIKKVDYQAMSQSGKTASICQSSSLDLDSFIIYPSLKDLDLLLSLVDTLKDLDLLCYIYIYILL